MSASIRPASASWRSANEWTVPMWPQPMRPIRSIRRRPSRSSVGSGPARRGVVRAVFGAPQAGTPAGAQSAPLEERGRADRVAAEPLPHRVERVVERAPVLGRRRRRAVVERRADPAPRRSSSSCWTETPSSRIPSSRSTAPEQVAGGVADLRARGRSGVGSVCDAGDRAEVARSAASAGRSAAVFDAARRRAATASAMRSASRSRPSRSVRSVANVSSWPIDFVTRSGSTGAVVAVPGQRVEVRAGGLARARGRASTRAARPGRRRSSTP